MISDQSVVEAVFFHESGQEFKQATARERSGTTWSEASLPVAPRPAFFPLSDSESASRVNGRRQAWASSRELLQSVARRTLERFHDSAFSKVERIVSEPNPGSEIPTVLVYAGLNLSDHALSFEQLAVHLARRVCVSEEWEKGTIHAPSFPAGCRSPYIAALTSSECVSAAAVLHALTTSIVTRHSDAMSKRATPSQAAPRRTRRRSARSDPQRAAMEDDDDDDEEGEEEEGGSGGGGREGEDLGAMLRRERKRATRAAKNAADKAVTPIDQFVAWYEELHGPAPADRVRTPDRRPPVTVLLEESESIEPSVLEEVVLTLSRRFDPESGTHRIPWRLVLGVSTAAETFQARLRLGVAARLDMRKVLLESPLEGIDSLVEALCISGSLPVVLASRALHFLQDHVLQYSLSVQTLLRGVEFALLCHFGVRPFSFLASRLPPLPDLPTLPSSAAPQSAASRLPAVFRISPSKRRSGLWRACAARVAALLPEELWQLVELPSVKKEVEKLDPALWRTLWPRMEADVNTQLLEAMGAVEILPRDLPLESAAGDWREEGEKGEEGAEEEGEEGAGEEGEEGAEEKGEEGAEARKASRTREVELLEEGMGVDAIETPWKLRVEKAFKREMRRRARASQDGLPPPPPFSLFPGLDEAIDTTDVRSPSLPQPTVLALSADGRFRAHPSATSSSDPQRGEAEPVVVAMRRATITAWLYQLNSRRLGLVRALDCLREALPVEMPTTTELPAEPPKLVSRRYLFSQITGAIESCAAVHRALDNLQRMSEAHLAHVFHRWNAILTTEWGQHPMECWWEPFSPAAEYEEDVAHVGRLGEELGAVPQRRAEIEAEAAAERAAHEARETQQQQQLQKQPVTAARGARRAGAGKRGRMLVTAVASTAFRADPLATLKEHVSDFLRSFLARRLGPAGDLALHEVSVFSADGMLRRALSTNSRDAVLTGLHDPKLYLRPQVPPTALEPQFDPSDPDICLLFRLFEAGSRTVNLHDWFRAFRAVVESREDEDPVAWMETGKPRMALEADGAGKIGRRRGVKRSRVGPEEPMLPQPKASPIPAPAQGDSEGDEDAEEKDEDEEGGGGREEEEEDERGTGDAAERPRKRRWKRGDLPKIKARFARGVKELRWLGVLRPSSHKADHVQRTVFDLTGR